MDILYAMSSTDLEPSARRTFVLVILFQSAVIAGLWLVGRIYG